MTAQTDRGRRPISVALQSLTERDRGLIESLARVRLLCARQVERLHFQEGSALTRARRCRRTLARLTSQHFLHRFERRIGGAHAGSSGYLYGLSAYGQRLLRTSGPAGGSRRRRPWEPSHQFQDHVLAVSELYVRLVEATRAGGLEMAAFDAEPSCWRRYLGHGGEGLILKPDAFVIVARGDFEYCAFVEVDLGTESIATIRRKVEAYRTYARTGVEQARLGVFPRLVLLVSDEPRAKTLVHGLRAVMSESPELSRIGLLDQAIDLLGGEQP